MSKFEIEYVSNKKVSCNGNSVLGHPLIYLEIKDNEVVCPYCSKTFILKNN